MFLLSISWACYRDSFFFFCIFWLSSQKLCKPCFGFLQSARFMILACFLSSFQNFLKMSNLLVTHILYYLCVYKSKTFFYGPWFCFFEGKVVSICFEFPLFFHKPIFLPEALNFPGFYSLTLPWLFPLALTISPLCFLWAVLTLLSPLPVVFPRPASWLPLPFLCYTFW